MGEGASPGSDKGTELNHGEIRVRRLTWEGLKGSGYNQGRVASTMYSLPKVNLS